MKNKNRIIECLLVLIVGLATLFLVGTLFFDAAEKIYGWGFSKGFQSGVAAEKYDCYSTLGCADRYPK